MRMVAGTRFILAFAALLTIYIDPSEPDRFVFETYLSMILYSLYSIVVYFSVIRQSRFIYPILKISHWLDVAWYVLLIALSSGTNSLFFFFFFFAILHSSFTYGFSSGFKVTLFSASAFIAVGFITTSAGADFELNRFLLRPIYLVVLGYLVAHWGGYEIKTKRRLALLREIVQLSNPRFGVDQSIGTTINLIRDFYGAENCLLLMHDAEIEEVTLYNLKGKNDLQTYRLSGEAARKLFLLPEHYAVIFGGKKFGSFSGKHNCYTLDLITKQTVNNCDHIFEGLAEKLDSDSFLTVPIYHRNEPVGRIFITTPADGSFDHSDIDFLGQAIDQFIPLIENIRLVDHLASDAAEEERRKIARDIHDSIVQPYIGLQLGIDSIGQFLEDESKDFGEKEEVFRRRIKKLKELTDKGIEDLRGYIHGLSKARGYESSLLPAVRRYAERFTNATGISVNIEAEESIQIADRLAAEVFQIIAEGLSNIRRHTQSVNALITLANYDGRIILAIVNNNDDNEVIHFTPRSISGRVRALGGSLEVRQETGKTAVRVQIPL